MTCNAPSKSSHATPRARDLWILALLLAFPSTGFIQKYTGMAGVAAYVVGVIALVYITAHVTRRFAPWLSRHFRSLAVDHGSSSVLDTLNVSSPSSTPITKYSQMEFRTSSCMISVAL